MEHCSIRERKNQLNSNLFITRSLSNIKLKDFTPLDGPLRILVVFSAPQDVTRLWYENEEKLFIETFKELIEDAEVEVELAPDSMLSTIRNYLDTEQFHILHYSGHSYFDEKRDQAYLIFEDENLNRKDISAEEFSKVITTTKYTPALVMLSSCQSAQGSNSAEEKENQPKEKGLTGLTNRLIQAGIPAVIGMGMSITDKYATVFSTKFYEEIKNKKDIHTAFKKAIEHTKSQEAEDNAGKGFTFTVDYS